MTINVLGSPIITFSVLFVCSKVISGCTRGFIELDLLRRRAEATGGAGNFLNEEFRLLPNENFSGNGTLTGLLLVGDIRANQGLRNQYPEIHVWRNTGGNNYTKQASQEIVLNQGDFSPDGVLQYNLTTPIPFQSGDVLGLYQPRQQSSVVRVYYDSSASTTYRVMGTNPTSPITIPNSLSSTNELILIILSPISDSPSCSSNFLSRLALRQGALNININNVIIRDNQRLFPVITFTCNGSIANWIVGASIGSGALLPELQIWRNTGGTSYTKAGFSLITNTTVINNVVDFTPNPPLEFQEGDILGVYQPNIVDSALVVYYQESDGPVNYEEGNSPLSTVILGAPVNQYDYPLVTVEINTAGTSSLVLTSLLMTSTVIVTTTTINSISRATVAPSNTSSPTSMEPGQNIILFTVVPVLLILFITIAIITISILLFIGKMSVMLPAITMTSRHKLKSIKNKML